MTQTPPPERRTGNLWIGMVLGVIVGLMVIALLWALTAGRPGTTATPSPAPTVTINPAGTPTPPATAPTPTASATASATPTPSPSASLTPTPSPTPTAPPEGIVTDLAEGSYLTVLESLRKSATTPQQALARASGLGNAQYPAVVIDSDEIDSLNAGYWVVAILGARDGAEAKARCAAVGESFGTDCYVRRIGG